MNANPLAGSIFDATTAGGIVQHEVVKKDVDCIIAEVDRDGMRNGYLVFATHHQSLLFQRSSVSFPFHC